VSDVNGVQNYQAEDIASDWPTWAPLQSTSDKTLIYSTVKPVFFACPLFREFREPGKFAKITAH